MARKQARHDTRRLAAVNLRESAEKLLDVLAGNPFQTPPPFEKLVGDFEGAYSRRINIQHRLVYQVLTEERTVKLVRMYTFYE